MPGIADHLQVVHALVQDLDRDVELLGHPYGLGFAATGAVFTAGAGAEGGGEVKGFHLNPLVKHDFHCQGGIETSGKKGEGFALHGFSWGTMDAAGVDIQRCTTGPMNFAHGTTAAVMTQRFSQQRNKMVQFRGVLPK
jgi:hypothetical protein